MAFPSGKVIFYSIPLRLVMLMFVLFRLLGVSLILVSGTSPSAARCKNDLDCQLNGRCDETTGACTCFDAWRGRECQFLNQGPGDALLRLPSSSSWGGRVIPAAVPGAPHHAFISVFGGQCGMNQWGNTSHIVHATISANETRFDKPATISGIAIPAYAHCVDVAQVNENLWIMVHN